VVLRTDATPACEGETLLDEFWAREMVERPVMGMKSDLRCRELLENEIPVRKTAGRGVTVTE
jgi:hypothetical protein